ncbi:MAG: response regulator transcription factor [Verrucomicrobia bacterium]|nr:response regulator transcription factor [Verrucomicrobiota bacterium]
MSSDESATVPSVLLVEDEAKTRESIEEGLRLEGWKVTGAADGKEARQRLDHERFDLIVLDWMLPECGGIEILRVLRGRGDSTPVLMLTARGALNDRVIGLDSGADDYLPKPFAFAELLARCRALLRRLSWPSTRLLQCGDLQLDTRERVGIRAGREIPLTPREVDVLEYLLRNQGQTVTREMLERDIWKQTHRMTSLDNVIDVQMMRLRKKVDATAAKRLIHTIRGVGYQLGRKAE